MSGFSHIQDPDVLMTGSFLFVFFYSAVVRVQDYFVIFHRQFQGPFSSN